MEVLSVISLTALVYTLTQWLKSVTNGQWNAVLTQVVAWAAGVIGVVLYAHSAWGPGVHVGSVSLASLNGVSQVLVGLGVASTASAAHDAKKAVDNSDSAATPPLIPPAR